MTRSGRRRFWECCQTGLWVAVVLWIMVGSCPGCAPVPRVAWENEPDNGPQWPPRPEPARISWIRSIASAEDAGITRSFWQQTLDFFTGPTRSPLVRPHGVLYDQDDRLFIADPGAGLVHCMELRGNRYFSIGGRGLQMPIGLAIDDRQRLYITDSVQGLVMRYDLAERTLKPLLTGRLQRPTGIAWNPINRLLYIVDTLANQVVVVNEEGLELKRIGGGEETVEGSRNTLRFNRPTDIWADARGQLYVVDPLNARIKMFTPEGQLLSEFGIAGDAPGELNKPKGVATDSEGHIYVTDALLDAVQLFARDGTPLLAFGAAGERDAEFWMPSGLFIDRQDRIFVADTYNRRVQVFRYHPAAVPTAADARSRP